MNLSFFDIYTMKITEASNKEIPIIADLAEKIWKAYYPDIISSEQINYMLDKMYSAPALEKQMMEGQRFFILSDNNQPIGYLSYSNTGEGNYFLHKFYVDTTQHRRGSGSSFFNEIFENIADIKTLRLTVNRQNYKAINFYFKKGFHIEEVKDFDIGNGYQMNDFIMLKTFNR